jgi:transglutaminase-like putative cysteine protease
VSITHSALPARTARAAVERYFEIALYLLVVTGFLTLAGTGKLEIIYIAVGTAALLYRGYLLVQRESLLLPESWSNYASLAYVLFYALDFLLISRNFVYANVHLVVFVMAVKLFSVRRDRDQAYLVVISFLLVLAAAVLTVDSIFFFLFCLFLVVAAATFISMEIRRSGRSAMYTARESSPERRRLGTALTVIAVVLTIAITIGCVGFFFVLPRGSGGFGSALAQSDQLLTGFSNEVRLGQIGEIKQSSTVIMRVQIHGDTRGEHSLLWRGVGLGMFDGRRWANPPGHIALPVSPDGQFHVARTLLANRIAAQYPPEFNPISYRVLMEPVGTNVLFVAPFVQTVQGPYRFLGFDNTGSLVTADGRPTTTYQGVSNIASPPPQLLRQAKGEYPPGIALRYLQLPAIDSRIRKLASEVTASAEDNYNKVVALESYLKNTYGYTLQLSKTAPPDPIAEFLFERKQGHCEYFASAMAVMLRSLGIPARLVNGFRSGQFNDLTSSYIIRASDAHTWVEAYFPGSGWVTFDPTPPDPRPEAGRWARMLLYIDAAREFWREWVINYDFAHRSLLHRQIFVNVSRRFAQVRSWIDGVYRSMLEHGRRSTRSISAPDLGIRLGILFILIMLIGSAREIWRMWRNWRLRAHPERAPRAAATVWYERLNSYLARRGFERTPAQTPAEFVQKIPEAPLRVSVARFTKHYERARFGNEAEDARRLPELYQEVVKR